MENPSINANNSKDNEITSLKLAAKTSDNKLRSFFESSSVIHILIDTELAVLDYNRAAQTFIRKYHNVEIHHGINIVECMHAEHTEGFMACYAKTLQGIPSRIERVLTYAGEKIVWFLAYEPAIDSEGVVIGMSFNAIDITERIANQNKISSQYHSLNEIAYMHSHNLRRPVSNIVGLMDLFKADDYTCSKDSLLMLEKAVLDLQVQLKEIERFTK